MPTTPKSVLGSGCPDEVTSPWRPILPVAAVGLLVAACFVLLQLLRLGRDITAPLFFGSVWGLDDRVLGAGLDVAVATGTGYDG